MTKKKFVITRFVLEYTETYCVLFGCNLPVAPFIFNTLFLSISLVYFGRREEGEVFPAIFISSVFLETVHQSVLFLRPVKTINSIGTYLTMLQTTKTLPYPK